MIRQAISCLEALDFSSLLPAAIAALVLLPLEHPPLASQLLVQRQVPYQRFPEEPIFYTPHHIPAP